MEVIPFYGVTRMRTMRSLILAVSAALCSCSNGSEPTYAMYVDTDDPYWSAPLSWFDANAWGPQLRVVFSDRFDDADGDHLLELFHSGERIDVPWTTDFVARNTRVDRGHTEVVYRVPTPEEYVVVHRRTDMPPGYRMHLEGLADGGGRVVRVDERSDGLPWVRFDGEDALVTTLASP